MRKVGKIGMLVTIVLAVLLFSSVIPIASAAFHVDKRGILEGTVAGNEPVNFELDISGVPDVYGVNIRTDLDDPSLSVEKVKREIEGDCLFVHPPATDFTVKISGKTPPSYHNEFYGYLEFMKLDEEEYHYYYVYVTDKNGVKIKDFKSQKKSFKLEKPAPYIKIEKGVAEIKNEELREVAKSLLNVGLVDYADKLTKVDITSHHVVWYKIWWIWLIIGLVAGILIVLIGMKYIKEKDLEGDDI